MLIKDPMKRITAEECLNHNWFQIQKFDTPDGVKESIVKKLKDFRAPTKIQMETLKFLVNHITDIDFKNMRDSFRAMDTENIGTISIDSVCKALKESKISYIDHKYIDQLFSRFDINKKGEINYSEFLAATIDKKSALTKANLRFAFHHWDTDNVGYITKKALKEVFKRQGQHVSDGELEKIIFQAKEPLTEEGQTITTEMNSITLSN